MIKKNPADGTYVLVRSQTLAPSTLIKFRDNIEGLTDSTILNTVRYVPHDSPEIPKNGPNVLESVKIASNIQGMQCRVALWPDDVCTILCFPATQTKPRKVQLLRAYRNASHAKRAIELNDLEVQGGAA